MFEKTMNETRIAGHAQASFSLRSFTPLLFAVVAACAVLGSCATAMSSGIDGFEPPLLPPYRAGQGGRTEFAVAGQAGASETQSLLIPFFMGFSSSVFAEGGGIFQWQADSGRKGFYGSASLGGWLSYSFSPYEDDPNWAPAADALSYGLSAALRIGMRLSEDANLLYVPSLQFRYSYEGGPYFSRREALYADWMDQAGEERPVGGYLNLKTSRHAWVATAAPLDISFPMAWGDMRIISELGWNEKWYPMVTEFVPDMWADPDTRVNAVLCALLPTNYEAKISLKFRGSGWYIGAAYEKAITSYLFPAVGLSLGAGYVW